MVEELFLLEVHENTEQEFINAFQEAIDIMQSANGYIESSLKQSVENEHNFVVSVTWNSVSDHHQFKETEGFEKVKQILSPYYLNVSLVQHYKKIV